MKKFKELSQEILKIYEESSKTFSDFQQLSKLTCLTGCGACCLSPTVEATPLEMLPLALHLWQIGKLDEYLDILKASEQKSCVLYQPSLDNPEKGRCQYYQYRPSVCRSFGAAAYRDKLGSKTLSLCKKIKADKQDNLPHALSLLENAPIIGTFASRIRFLDPQLSKEVLPINQALKVMLEKVSFYAQYELDQV
jgi:uncharacterized protein